MRILVTAALLLAVALLPKDPPFNATLTSPYGTAPARDGFLGAEFVGNTEAPALLPGTLTRLRGDLLTGDVQVTSAITDSGRMTITVALDADIGRDFGTLSGPCGDYKAPVGASALVTGTVDAVQWDAANRYASFTGRLQGLGGNSCLP